MNTNRHQLTFGSKQTAVTDPLGTQRAYSFQTVTWPSFDLVANRIAHNVMKTIYLFTSQYPYGQLSETFIETELAAAAALPDVRLTVIPVNRKAGMRPLPPPPSVTLDERLATRPFGANIRAFGRLFASRWLWRLPFEKNRPRSANAWFYAVKYLFGGFLIESFLLKNQGNFPTDAIFYSYWSNHTAFGFALAKRHAFVGSRFVARAHSYDLYGEQGGGLCAPWREFVLRRLNATFTVSDSGRQFLTARYPQCAGRIFLARLGVRSEDVAPLETHTGALQFVSCSAVIAVKRVDAILRALTGYARSHPERAIVWTHLGGGALLEQLRQQAEKNRCTNLKIALPGAMRHAQVLDFLRTNGCHIFVNLSALEGVPVSIMEAMSFGIPALAADVGGNGEIVTAQSGRLLPSGFTQRQYDNAVDEILADKSLRAATKRFLEENYNARHNYHRFYQTQISQ